MGPLNPFPPFPNIPRAYSICLTHTWDHFCTGARPKVYVNIPTHCSISDMLLHLIVFFTLIVSHSPN